MTADNTSASALLTGIGLLVAAQGIVLWIGAIAHTGIEVPLGFIVVSEPQILPAVLVEGACSLLLIGSSYAVFMRKSWAWYGVLIAQTVALGGVLLGITAITLGAGPHTTANAFFHRAMLVLLVGGLLLVLTPATRRSFRTSLGHHP